MTKNQLLTGVSLPDFRNTFDASKGFQGLLFHSNRHLGAHELVVTQEIQRHQRQLLAEYTLRDGALTKGGKIVIGTLVDGMIEVRLEEGRVYIRGAIHDLAARTIQVSATGTVIVGARLTTSTVTWLQDTTLKGQAPGTRAHGEPMASALVMLARWGYDGDGDDGDLYPIYTIRDGVLIDENPPPNVDPYTSLIERYDREVHGGYIVNGYQAMALGPDGNGNQVFVVSEGTVNVWGRKRSRPQADRLIVKEEPDLELVQSEPLLCSGAGPHVLSTRFGPISSIAQVTILAEREVTLTHGPFDGAMDSLPDPSVQEIVSVTQEPTVFPNGSYVFRGNALDWAGSGAEPAPGSSYKVVYRYFRVVQPDEVTDRTVTISGAAPDTTALVHYRFKLPRIDAIVVDRYGNLDYIKGVSSRLAPQPVDVDPTLLKIADVYVVWGDLPKIVQVGTVHVEQAGIRALEKMVGNLYALVAAERLKNDITSRDPAAKLGVFSDPLLDDDLRDQGLTQSGAIVNGELHLPIVATVHPLTVAVTTLPYEDEIVIEQSYVTEEHKINPYMGFAAPPVVATLSPAVDTWTEEISNWTSIDTARFVTAAGSVVSNPAIGTQWQVAAQWTEQKVLASRTEAVEFIRPRPVAFTLEGFGPGETLVELTFDGVDVTP